MWLTKASKTAGEYCVTGMPSKKMLRVIVSVSFPPTGLRITDRVLVDGITELTLKTELEYDIVDTFPWAGCIARKSLNTPTG